MKVQHMRTEAYVIPLPGGGEIVADANAVVDVPDDLGARLLEQPDNWQPASKK